MAQQLHRKAQAQIVIGVFALAIASITLTEFHNDFFSGLGFGIGVPLLLLGIYKIRRQRG